MEQPDGTRRCYYDIMELPLKATDEEIRRQYKKLSLKYHPDKNIDNQAEAMIIFKQVQAAYGVLSDPQEKAWYDSHRTSILAGEGEGSCEPDGIDIYNFLNPRCYTGLGDDEGGFFHVYRGAFATIAKEETEHCEDTTKKPPVFPPFGDSTSPYMEVVYPFYLFWQNYSSRKSFAWMDEYKTNDIPDRNMRRAAERHNQKLRETARREFTSLIRELVEYVRRRDPRVRAENERIKAEAETKEKERVEREEAKRKARVASNKKLWEEAAAMEAERDRERAERGEDIDSGSTLEQLYAKQGISKYFFEKPDGEGGAEGGEGADDGGADGGGEQWSCPACKKHFKSLNLWKDHERSAKHKTKLKQLAAKGTDVDALMATAKQSHVDPTVAEPAVAEPPAAAAAAAVAEPEPEPEPAPSASKAKKAAKYQQVHSAGKSKKGFAPPTLPEDDGSSGSSSGSEEEAAPSSGRGGGFGAFATLNKKKGKR